MNISDFLQKLLSFFKISQDNKNNADYWNDKWKHNRIIYKAQGGFNRDVRTYLFDHSYLLEDMTKKYNLTGNDDGKALKILKWAINNIKYAGDEDIHKQKEFWQNPEETIQRETGDCEDGALLIKSLALVAGIPDYKMKICCGSVKGGGHAYAIYLREKTNLDDCTWCVLDWCYSPNLLPIDEREEHKNEENYYDIWFTFNKEFTFAQNKAEYSKGKLKKKG